MSCRIEIKPSAERALSHLPRDAMRRVGGAQDDSRSQMQADGGRGAGALDRPLTEFVGVHHVEIVTLRWLPLVALRSGTGALWVALVLFGTSAACGSDVQPICGNGVAEGSEECDDGRNGNPVDGCTDACRFSCHRSTEALDCNEMADDCVTWRCVPDTVGQVCESYSFPGQCRYWGCRDGPMDVGWCVDFVCVCDHVAEPDGGTDEDAGAPDGG